MISFIFNIALIIMGIVGIIVLNKFEKTISKDMRAGVKIYKKMCIIPMVLGIIFICINTVKIVSPGDAYTTEFLGNVSNKVLYSGINYINPMASTKKFNIKTQEMTKSMKIPAKDQLAVTVDTTIQYRVNPAQLPIMRETYGGNLSNFMTVIFLPAMGGAYRDAAADFSSSELYIEKRAEYQATVLKNLREQVGESFFIEDIIIRNVTPPDAIVMSIERKQEAQQEAQRMKFVLEKTKLEAEQKVIEAEGIANAQDIIANKLTPAYLSWYKIDMMKNLVDSPNNTIIFIPDDTATPPVILNQK